MNETRGALGLETFVPVRLCKYCVTASKPQ